MKINFDKKNMSINNLDYNSSSGAGMGLIIIQHICKRLKFDITVLSEKNKGSIFTLKVPLYKKKAHDLITYSESKKSIFRNNQNTNSLNQPSSPVKYTILNQNNLCQEVVGPPKNKLIFQIEKLELKSKGSPLLKNNNSDSESVLDLSNLEKKTILEEDSQETVKLEELEMQNFHHQNYNLNTKTKDPPRKSSLKNKALLSKSPPTFVNKEGLNSTQKKGVYGRAGTNNNIIDLYKNKKRLSTLSILRKESSFIPQESNIVTEESSCKKKILVCDDSLTLVNTLFKLLNSIPQVQEKYEIVKGSDGINILHQILENQISKNLKLVISDENMEYVNGSAALRIIRNLEEKQKMSNETFFFSLTAFEDEDTKAEIAKSGFNKVMIKPVSKVMLKKALVEFNIIEE
eukprot:CAMPEP_0170515112 /NCGR_PEP_ID=MMETSP0209-20121228/1594_1 /TAXON_ID=665100 ORGANISM="Litonotus pictus, Strain P1" /NCGR_SAMPLE_ID=MMETSP0209 /ASSEMBLY_ACC=CAM_ASM_000301 /LENGTH=402 /DNA_ID=CAMNT_0010799453 /DNA_START=2269 /DNA_END=3477 /DNA_ORIENTATION=+